MSSKLQVIALALALAGGSATAFAQREEPEPRPLVDSSLLTKQNIGRAVGGVVGGLIGSRFGGGTGRIATTAVGAVAGFLVGGALGERLDTTDRQALSRDTTTALETGNTQSWRNPETGVSTRVSVEDTRVQRRPIETAGLRARLRDAPALEMINAFYLAEKDSNVRGGPGTEYDVMGVMRAGERIAVVGKVKAESWYMVSDDGLGSGFVYAPLLRRDPRQPQDQSAVRAVAGQQRSTQVGEERTCSLVTQQVTLTDGSTETHQVTACRQPDGTWVEA